MPGACALPQRNPRNPRLIFLLFAMQRAKITSPGTNSLSHLNAGILGRSQRNQRNQRLTLLLCLRVLLVFVVRYSSPLRGAAQFRRAAPRKTPPKIVENPPKTAPVRAQNTPKHAQECAICEIFARRGTHSLPFLESFLCAIPPNAPKNPHPLRKNPSFPTPRAEFLHHPPPDHYPP